MDAPNPKIDIAYKQKGGGKIQVVVKWDGGSFTDLFRVLDEVSRARFVKRLMGKHPQIDQAAIVAELDRIAEETATRSMEGEGEDEVGGSDDEILIQIGRDENQCELFRSGADDSAEAYARIRRDNHFVHHAVRSRTYASWLRNEFFQRLDRSPSSEAFNSAINTLEAAALHRGERIDVYQRVAPVEGGVAIDLCDEEWSVVLVTEAGWRVVPNADSPVRFTRRRGMMPLPRPVPGGSIGELRPFVNLPHEDGWVLFVCTLTSVLNPRGPYVVLVLSGEQGSAKSTTAKRARSLTDPNQAPVRRLPRDDRDLMIAARNAHVQAFDNLSTISAAISDALCSLVTGGGYATRQLYTDSEEMLFHSMRPVLMNGIEDVATRPDLLDRCVVLALPPISEVGRREEKEMDSEFEAARPRIFGALLDGVATALRRHDSIRLTRRPRMADFARWCAASETAFGFGEGTFLAAYERNRRDAVAIALESSTVFAPLSLLMGGQDEWSGTAGELLRVLEGLVTDQRTKDRHDWPTNAKGMAEALKRIAPALRMMGIEVTTGERTNDSARHRLITIRRLILDDPDDPDGLFGTSGGREPRAGGPIGAVDAAPRPPSARISSSGPSGPSKDTRDELACTASSEPSEQEGGMAASSPLLADAARHEASMEPERSPDAENWRSVMDNREAWQ